ncbi:MAG TPA: NAD(+)/NADH kinase [Egibacteraceae bacterium]|nr:NAD(+)/NADH kinase [Egibacteraceae bacterium]
MSDTPSRVQTVGLVVHGGRSVAAAAAESVRRSLAGSGVTVVAVKGDGWGDGDVDVRTAEEFGEGLDIVIAMGGDGTFLRAAYLARDRGIPLLGVNLGRLGFLSEVESGQLDDALGRLVSGDFDVEERMTLSVSVHDPDGAVVATAWALNDASVERTVPQRLIVFEVQVNETVLANVPADAIICATPTGSTAYAFSAGGPILSPLVDAILLTPVAPHSLFNRTLVVDSGEVLHVRQVAGEGSSVVSCDGRESLAVPNGGGVRVSRGELPVRMARLAPFDFYQRVRDKFGLT